MNDGPSGAIIWPLRVAFGVALMFLSRWALQRCGIACPHLFLTVGLALAMWAAIWLVGNGLRTPEGGLRRSYDNWLRDRR